MAEELDFQDYADIALMSENIREIVAAVVEGLKADGFTDREARLITAGVFAARISEPEQEGGES